jgi:glycosyltransferase involved in cell wall biosynthesis
MNPAPGRPRLGVVDFNPIQYHTPLYQRLTRRDRVSLDVLFLTDDGRFPVVDPGFGVPVAWNIDLLTGYPHRFLAAAGTLARAAGLARWTAGHDAVVIHGYSHPWMLLAALLCRARGIPFLLRGDSGPCGWAAAGPRRHARDAWVRAVVSASAGGLAIGTLNTEFYRRFGARRIFFAPYSVDDERFARPPAVSRAELLARWGQPGDRPLVLYCGKIYQGKRPLDLPAAASKLDQPVTLMFVGDGVQGDEVRACLPPGSGVVTGFVNQSELPAYYHAADVLVLPSEAEKWGLVINEAMAAGALPVVSDRVGAATDLVAGVGEVYPCGDVASLAAALGRAVERAGQPGVRERVRRHADRFSLDRTAAGFEEAALAVSGLRRAAASGR